MSRIFSTLFPILLLAYVVFVTFEEFIPGSVSEYFNPHWLLILIMVFLVVMLVLERGKPQKMPQTRKGTGLLIFLAGAVTLVVIWVGAYEFSDFWRGLLAIYGSLIVVGILSILFKD